MYAGPEAFDAYAHFLHSFGHGLGVWFARFGLLGCIGLHIAATICLVMQNREAKKQNYEKDTFVQANRMVIKGFQSPLIVLFYIAAMTCLCSHLSHGVASIFQTLGLRTKKNAQLIFLGSWAYTIIIYVGFISIPIAVFFKIIS